MRSMGQPSVPSVFKNSMPSVFNLCPGSGRPVGPPLPFWAIMRP